MTEKNRTPYQREMDQIHVPEAKAKETLQKMLTENRRLREEAKKHPQKQLFSTGNNRKTGRMPRLVPVFAIAGVAACALLVIGLTSRSGNNQLIQGPMTAPLIENVSRDGTEEKSSFIESFGITAETLFPGWTVTKEVTEANKLGENVLHVAKLELNRGNQLLIASVYDFQPAAWSLKGEEKQIAGKSVYLMKDTASQSLTGAYQQDNLYIVLSGELTGQEFFQALEEILSR